LLSLGGGPIGFTFAKEASLEKFLGEIGITLLVPESAAEFFTSYETWLSIIGCTLGVILSYLMYTKYVDRFKEAIPLLKNSFYVNEIYSAVFVKPLRAFARMISQWMEPEVFDRMIQGAAEGTQGTARVLQKMQSGQIRSYAAWMVIGVVGLLTYIIANHIHF
jgi:NADH-quinone oxidoreductase subunit L